MKNSKTRNQTSSFPPHDSRKNKNLSPFFWFFPCVTIKPLLAGTIRMPPLRDFTMTLPRCVTTIPDVVKSSPGCSQDCMGPATRSARRRAISQSHDDPHLEEERSSYSRSQIFARSSGPRRLDAEPDKDKIITDSSNNSDSPIIIIPSTESLFDKNHCPDSSSVTLIHNRLRKFISRHEIPRKLLHVSIGVFSIYLYLSGVQTTSITPWLLSALVPITTTDILRLRYEPLNKIYIRILGPLMRESEHHQLNGVIWYLIGAWFVLATFPKDIGLMGILLLSWCDTAASTIGRAFGRYTPRIRRGKSLAGSGAAFAVGTITAAAFWGWLAPGSGPFPDDHNFPFMFTNSLHLPKLISDPLGLSEKQNSVTGWMAVSIMSIWTGFIASTSEAIAFFDLDDNLTIPAVSGIGMWGFLKVFG